MGVISELRATWYSREFLRSVKGGHLQDVARCLDKGADVNQEDHEGTSALLLAAAGRHLEVMELLLRNGACFDSDDAALFLACCGGGLDAARLLYRFILDVGTRDMFLAASAAGGFQEVTQFLLERGADVNAADARGWTPLMMASEAGHREMVDLLLEKEARVNAMDASGCTALMAACQFGRHDVASLLIDHGANVNARSLTTSLSSSNYGAPENWLPPGMTALAWAARNGHTTLVELLLAHGALPDARDGGGWTPLMWAVVGGHSQAAARLLDQAADQHARVTMRTTGLFSVGSTVLMMAACRGRTEAAAVLLQHGAEPSATDREGKTPLMAASRFGHVDMVRLLLKHKSPVNDKDREGLSALAYALMEQRDELAQLLRTHGAEEPEVSREALPLTHRYPMPPKATVLGKIPLWAVMAGLGSVLVLIGGLWIGGRDFSSWSVLEERLVGRGMSSFLGLMSWWVSEPAATIMGLLWVGLCTVILLGLGILFSRRLAEAGQWDTRLWGSIGRATLVGGLTLAGCLTLLTGACLVRGLSEGVRASQEIPYATIPGYFVCAGALILAFINSGRERFSLLIVAGLGLFIVASAGFQPGLGWEEQESKTTVLFSLACATMIIVFMVLTIAVSEDSVRLRRTRLWMVFRGVLLLPVIALVTVVLMGAAAILTDYVVEIVNKLWSAK